jgi:hypothetical protein
MISSVIICLSIYFNINYNEEMTFDNFEDKDHKKIVFNNFE